MSLVIPEMEGTPLHYPGSRDNLRKKIIYNIIFFSRAGLGSCIRSAITLSVRDDKSGLEIKNYELEISPTYVILS